MKETILQNFTSASLNIPFLFNDTKVHKKSRLTKTFMLNGINEMLRNNKQNIAYSFLYSKYIIFIYMVELLSNLA